MKARFAIGVCGIWSKCVISGLVNYVNYWSVVVENSCRKLVNPVRNTISAGVHVLTCKIHLFIILCIYCVPGMKCYNLTDKETKYEITHVQSFYWQTTFISKQQHYIWDVLVFRVQITLVVSPPRCHSLFKRGFGFGQAFPSACKADNERGCVQRFWAWEVPALFLELVC